MNKSKSLPAIFGMIVLVPMLMSVLLPVSLGSPAEPMPLVNANAGCAKQKSILRQLEKPQPAKKLTRKQLLNRIKAACDKMRRLDCPDIRNYRPSICFTDF